MRIAINGFGRIGRAFLKIALDDSNLNIVAINDLGNIENFAYLLKRDTVYGLYSKKVEVKLPNTLVVDNKEILFLQEKDPLNLPWKQMAIDVVIEATGVFEDYTKAKAHIEAGAKKVIITAPAKGEEAKDGRIVLLGINDSEIKNFEVVSNGSCTTNAISPVLAVLDEKIGIQKAILNTVHAYTATQSLVDGAVKGSDYLRGRAAASNIVPSTTGAALTIAKALTNLAGKFDGLAIRVPVNCGSLADLTFLARRPTSKEEINQVIKKAALEQRWQGILGYSEEPLVSSDVVKDFRPAVVDLSFTKVVDNDLVKVLIWYDNEWGYAQTLALQLQKLQI